MINEQRFRHVWKLLCRTYEKEGHCLRKGCGKETLQYWVAKVTHTQVPRWELKQTLEEATRRGWVKQTRQTWYQGSIADGQLQRVFYRCRKYEFVHGNLKQRNGRVRYDRHRH